MLAPVLAVAQGLSVCLCPSVFVTHKSGFYRKGLMDGLIWLLAWWLLSTSPILCYEEF